MKMKKKGGYLTDISDKKKLLSGCKFMELYRYDKDICSCPDHGCPVSNSTAHVSISSTLSFSACSRKSSKAW